MSEHADILPLAHGPFNGFPYFLHFRMAEKFLVVALGKGAERKRAQCGKTLSCRVGASYEDVVIAGIAFLVRVFYRLVVE